MTAMNHEVLRSVYLINFKANTFAISLPRLTPSTMGTAWDLDDLDDLCNSFMSDQKLSLVFWEKEQANFFCSIYCCLRLRRR